MNPLIVEVRRSPGVALTATGAWAFADPRGREAGTLADPDDALDPATVAAAARRHEGVHRRTLGCDAAYWSRNRVAADPGGRAEAGFGRGLAAAAQVPALDHVANVLAMALVRLRSTAPPGCSPSVWLKLSSVIRSRPRDFVQTAIFTSVSGGHEFAALAKIVWLSALR